MHWRFDPLFSIKINHTKYLIPNGSTEQPAAEDFTLEPTRTTKKRLKELGWVFKAQLGVCTVYGEKVFEASGNASLRSMPDAKESFAFFLKLNNAAILNETKPFVLASQPELKPNPNLPAFSGRTRLLYFDNLNPVSLSGGELSISAGSVDIAHFASAAPTLFRFERAKTGVKNIKFTAIAPQTSVTQFDLNPETHAVDVRLPENGYRLEQTPGGPTETLVLISENVVGNTLGLVRIFNPNTTSWEPPRRYQIEFEKV